MTDAGDQNGGDRHPDKATSCGPTGQSDPANARTSWTFPAYIGTGKRTTRHDSAEDAGIRAGEITSYRAWRYRLDDGCLYGMWMADYKWPPRQIVYEPDISWYGFYSFKDPELALASYWYHADDGHPVVFGQIQIWGEVIEHERGYRSQYAKIIAIDRIRPWTFEHGRSKRRLEAVRQHYGV